MALYEYLCPKCDKQFELIAKEDEVVICDCGEVATRIFPTKSPSFTLKYNPKTDMVDWDGNRTRRYDAWKEAKREGKKVEIPGE